MKLVNGKGNGEYGAEVNVYNQLETNSIIEPKISYVSDRKGNTFTMGTGIRNLGAVDEWLLIALIKNIDSLKHLKVWNLIIGWNGGNTSRNHELDMKWIISPTPTANYTMYTPRNMNFSSTVLPNVEAYIWDGVGTGITMTGSSLGNEQILGVGRNQLQLDGVPIIGFNNSIGVMLRADEIGKFSLVSQFYMEERHF